MYEHILPVGSVVKLTGAEKEMMIFGLFQTKTTENGTCYDYIGVPYPEGNLDIRLQIVFNHSDIETVLFRGYENQSWQDFKGSLNLIRALEKHLEN